MSHPKPKRNKKYQPRRVVPFGGLFVIADKHVAAEDSRPIIADDQTDLSLAYRLAFEQMTKGESNEQSWCIVVCSLNVALILAERGIGHEYEPYLIKALDGAFTAKLRAQRHGVWRFDGEAISAIRQAFEVHDEQIKIATKHEMRDALLEVRRRIDEGNTYQEAA